MNDKYIVIEDTATKVYKDPITFSDNEQYLIALGSVVETVTVSHHGDWKTAMVQGIPPIPQGIQLIVHDVWQNFYGLWITAYYNGRSYDINPRDLKYIRMKE